MESLGEGRYRVATDPRFWNQIGPFGGWLAGQALRAMQAHADTDAHMVPRSFTAHFVGALKAGELELKVQVLRRQRTVAALRAEILQAGEIGVSAECIFGIAREGPSLGDAPHPPLDSPLSYPRSQVLDGLAAFPRNFDYRIAQGEPLRRAGAFESCGYVRLDRQAPPDAGDMLMLADAWYPACWAGLAEPVPVTTLTMSVLFHRMYAAEQAHAHQFLAVRHQTREIAQGYADERGELWLPDGQLALQCQQLTWINFSKRHGRAAQAGH